LLLELVSADAEDPLSDELDDEEEEELPSAFGADSVVDDSCPLRSSEPEPPPLEELYRSEYQPPPFRMNPPPREI
jgi:hypothetical protein